jgi:hypothetical protein
VGVLVLVPARCAAIRGPIVINVVIYAEFSIGYTRIEEVEQVLSDGLKSEKFHERHYFLPVRCFSGIEHEEAHAAVVD